MSVYRVADAAPCHQCEAAASESCACCRRPTCTKHLDNRKMCGRCDEAYYRWMKSDEGSGSVAFSLPLMIVGGLVVGLASSYLLWLAIAMPFVGFPAILIVRKKRRRARFFKTMRERGALPAPKQEEPHAEELALARYQEQVTDRAFSRFEHASDPDEPDR